MQHRIDEHGRLVITVDDEERAELREVKEENPEHKPWGSDALMYDFFEQMVCNSELQWIDPDVTGDLTDAPMLAILGADELGPPEAARKQGLSWCGCWDGQVWYQPVLFRWAFMDYQVRGVLDDLLDEGKAIFTGGAFLERPEAAVTGEIQS